MAFPRVALASRPVDESPTAYTEKSLAQVRSLVAEAVAACCDLPALVGGKTVLVKPNLVRPDPRNPCAVVTDERVTLAVVALLRLAGAGRVLVGDNPGYGLSLPEAVACLPDFCGRLAEAGGELISFDRDESAAVANPGAFLFDPVHLPRAVLEADLLVNVPKMKTHVHTLVTLGVKNLYGLVGDRERMFCHRNDINAKVVDILRLVKPALTVVDGLWAVQGQAPLSGAAVPDMNVIAAGTDVCAVDTVCADLMGIGADEVAMLRLARQEGLGETDLRRIEVVGADPAKLRRSFTRPVIGCAGAYDAVRVGLFGLFVGPAPRFGQAGQRRRLCRPRARYALCRRAHARTAKPPPRRGRAVVLRGLRRAPCLRHPQPGRPGPVHSGLPAAHLGFLQGLQGRLIDSAKISPTRTSLSQVSEHLTISYQAI